MSFLTKILSKLSSPKKIETTPVTVRINKNGMRVEKGSYGVMKSNTGIGSFPYETYLNYTLTNYAINTVIKALRDAVLDRDYAIIGGEEEDRQKLIYFFKNCINFPEWISQMIFQLYSFGKHIDEVIKEEILVDENGEPVKDEDGSIIFKPIQDFMEYSIKPVSCAVIEEVYSPMGFIRYFKYNYSVDGITSMQGIIPPDSLAVFVKDRIPGYKRGIPFYTPLGYHIEHIQRCDENLNIATDKQVLGFLQVFIDPVYLDKFGASSKQLIDMLQTVLNSQEVGDDIIMLPGMRFEPVEFSEKSIEGILKLKESLFNEVIINNGLTPSYIRGETLKMPDKDKITINSLCKQISGYISSQIIPKLLGKKITPILKFKMPVELQIEKAKADIIYASMLQDAYKKIVAEEHGINPEDIKDTPKIIQPQTEPTTQIEPYDETGAFREINANNGSGDEVRINYIGGKKIKDE